MLVGQPLQPSGGLGGAAERQQHLEALLGRDEAELVPANGRRTGPLLVGDVCQARPTPLTEGRVEEIQRGDRIGRDERGRRRDTVLEATDVERVGRDVEHVTGAVAADEVGRAEGTTQERDVALQRVGGGRRGLATPDVVDQPVDRDDLAGDEREAGEHGTLARPTERAGVTVANGGHWTQQPDVDVRPLRHWRRI